MCAQHTVTTALKVSRIMIISSTHFNKSASLYHLGARSGAAG